ncbi:hypothetical protein MMC13_000898 [Lambiella insularis]|nr:hypothetical protein [Lambiella insularis]
MVTESSSFCRKTTLKKHVVRSHLARSTGDMDLSGTDLDEDLDEDESPSPVMQSRGIHYDRSHWNLPPQPPLAALPHHTQTAPNKPHYVEQHIKCETMQTSPSTSVPCRTNSDPGYINYPFPQMSQAQLQSITSAPMSSPTPLMPLVRANHGSFRERGPMTTVQTNLDMMTGFSLPDQITPQPLQSSPSTMSSGSSGPDSSVSQDYRQEYSSPTSYQSPLSYNDPQARLGFPHLQHMQPVTAQHTYPVPTCNMPGQQQVAHQQHLLSQHYDFETQQQIQNLQYQAVHGQQEQARTQQLQPIQLARQFDHIQPDQQQQVLQHQYQHQQAQPDDQYESVPYQEPVHVGDAQEPSIVNVYSNWDPQYKLDELELVDGQPMPNNAVPAWGY